MAEKKIVQIDSVDTYNKLYGWETLHPLVTVVNHTVELPTSMNHTRLFKKEVGMTPSEYRN